ncbi:MAG: hypothetical protein HC895_02890 [Leptolyngbyaceae cyanobacterium SM1_3_5]|nr:hypothetical protein [Leptolyngbyaceae cyanobacterium SM1_3_5]
MPLKLVIFADRHGIATRRQKSPFAGRIPTKIKILLYYFVRSDRAAGDRCQAFLTFELLNNT